MAEECIVRRRRNRNRCVDKLRYLRGMRVACQVAPLRKTQENSSARKMDCRQWAFGPITHQHVIWDGPNFN